VGDGCGIGDGDNGFDGGKDTRNSVGGGDGDDFLVTLTLE
jgi:hypothetical protein